jgi:hypothetical protein
LLLLAAAAAAAAAAATTTTTTTCRSQKCESLSHASIPYDKFRQQRCFHHLNFSRLNAATVAAQAAPHCNLEHPMSNCRRSRMQQERREERKWCVTEFISSSRL